MIKATLCLLLKPGYILLAMKKRGFGAGKWNGAGGKFDPEVDKNIFDTAIREVKEEINVDILNPEKVADFLFYFPHKPEWNLDVSLFTTREWKGEPSESDEMAPKWFPVDKIPYESMWSDDPFWMPHILAGKKLKGEFTFSEDGSVSDHKLEIIDEFINMDITV